MGAKKCLLKCTGTGVNRGEHDRQTLDRQRELLNSANHISSCMSDDSNEALETHAITFPQSSEHEFTNLSWVINYPCNLMEICSFLAVFVYLANLSVSEIFPTPSSARNI